MITNSAFIYGRAQKFGGDDQDQRIKLARARVEALGAQVHEELHCSELDLVKWIKKYEQYDPVLVVFSLQDVTSLKVAKTLVELAMSIVVTSELDLQPSVAFVSKQVTRHAVNNLMALEAFVRETEKREAERNTAQHDMWAEEPINEINNTSAKEHAETVWENVVALTKVNMRISQKEICKRLENAGIRTQTGKKITAIQLRRYARYIEKEDQLELMLPKESAQV